MASGQVVGIVTSMAPPGANRARPGVRTTASSPNGRIPILSFDDTATQHWDFIGYLAGYAGGGLSVTFTWGTASTGAGTPTFQMAFRRWQHNVTDIYASFPWDPTWYKTATPNAPADNGKIVYTTLNFSVAESNSLANNEAFVFRFRRTPPAGVSGNVELIWPLIIIKEQ